MLAIVMLCFLFTIVKAADFSITKGEWIIRYHAESRALDYQYGEKIVLQHVCPEATYTLNGEDVTISSATLSNVSYQQRPISDNFGAGTVYTIKFETLSSPVSLEQDLFFYESYPYLVTELRLVSDEEIASNYLAPLLSVTPTIFPDGDASDNRMLLVPWDNDGFVRYACCKLNTDLTSYEVSSIYNGGTNEGLVAGSISHDTWKSAVYIKASGGNSINEFKCYSGVSSNLTRDNIPHGKVKGKTVSSAKMLLGYFNDWRLGMEAFGHANTLIVPARTTWTRGTPLGWNSWGVIMEKINFTNISEVAKFYKDELYDRGFHNEQGHVIIDLDSFWSEGLPRDNVRTKFAADCKERGQIPGIYWGPFANWGGLDNTVEEIDWQCYFNECTLYANGEPVTLDGAYCLDPTHPAVKERITKMFAKFRSWGYEYIKLDFVNFGAIQADSYYNPNITTAIQAYNEGFQHLLDAAGDMFISLSIAPTFPYQYGNSRRISCDAWGTIGHTEYVMNALSYGWWTDQFYQYNDPDHVVLQREGESERTNRARLTSAAITGMLLLGDNFSTTYTERGNPTISKDRAIRLATNPDIIKITCLGGSFKPVYGHKTTSTTTAENLFMRRTDDYLYVAGINYTSMRRVSGTILLEHLGIEASQIESIEEVWTGDSQTLENGALSYEVPASDARIYKIKLVGGENSISSPEITNQRISLFVNKRNISIQAKQKLIGVDVFSLQGQLLLSQNANAQQVNVLLPDATSGVYLVKCRFENNEVVVEKCIVG